MSYKTMKQGKHAQKGYQRKQFKVGSLSRGSTEQNFLYHPKTCMWTKKYQK